MKVKLFFNENQNVFQWKLTRFPMEIKTTSIGIHFFNTVKPLEFKVKSNGNCEIKKRFLGKFTARERCQCAQRRCEARARFWELQREDTGESCT